MDISKTIQNVKIKLIDDYLNVVRNKVQDLNNLIWENEDVDSLMDQHPGKCIPFCYTRMFGPITTDQISKSKFILPRLDQGNIKVGREGSFHWLESSYAVYQQIRHANGDQFGDIFDDSVGDGYQGGARRIKGVNSNLYDFFGNLNYFSFDIQLYDKKRGKLINENLLPFEYIMGGANFNYENKTIDERIVFDPNTEIEPRIFVNGPPQGIRTDPSRIRYFVNIMFKGYLELESENLKQI